jgi:hypothetical protein
VVNACVGVDDNHYSGRGVLFGMQLGLRRALLSARAQPTLVAAAITPAAPPACR